MTILNRLLEITLYSSIIAVVTLLLKKLFSRRMSPWLHYAVWFVLIARLMLPVTVESGFHVFTVPAQTQTQTAAVPQAPATANVAQTADVTSNGYQPQPMGEYEPTESTVSPVLSTAPVTLKPLSTENVVLIVWLSGAGLALLYIAVLYGTLRRRVRKNAAEPSARLLNLFDDVKAEMNIKARMKLVCQYEYGTPALLLPATVLMPVDTVIAMDDEQIRFALRHELTHYRRGDHIACLLISLLHAIYWFNPLVWLAFRQMRADMEIACDSKVVKALDVPQRSRYASLIVSLFAQTQRRQLMLGLAQGNAKKIAEQRVRGIFKESKSHGSVKFISAFAAVLLLVTCFTTACQPTPEKAVVVNKGDNHLEEMIASSAVSSASMPSPSAEPTLSEEEKAALQQALRESIDTPETYADSFANKKGDVTVTIDATVDVPAVSALPAAAVTMSGFTQEEVDKLAAYFLGDVALYTKDYTRTKDEIQDELINQRQLLLDLSKKSNDGAKDMVKQVKADIAKLEEDYKTAPEQRATAPSTTELRSNENGSFLQVYTDLGRDEPALFDVFNYPNGSTFSFNNDGKGLYYPSMHRAEELDGIPRGMTMKREDAEQLVLKCIDDLGISGMQIASVQTQNYLNIFDDVNDEAYMKTANQCYVFTLTKTVKGLPISLIDTSVPFDSDDPNVPASQESEYTAVVGPEHIYVYVDDTGIVCFEWYDPTDISTVLSDQVTLLPFSEIAERAKNNIFYKNYTAYGSTADIYISRIELNMMRIMRKDKPGEYLIVPVWDFIGDDKVSYEGEEPHWSLFGDQSYVTINAIDGSWINRD